MHMCAQSVWVAVLSMASPALLWLTVLLSQHEPCGIPLSALPLLRRPTFFSVVTPTPSWEAASCSVVSKWPCSRWPQTVLALRQPSAENSGLQVLPSKTHWRPGGRIRQPGRVRAHSHSPPETPLSSLAAAAPQRPAPRQPQGRHPPSAGPPPQLPPPLPLPPQQPLPPPPPLTHRQCAAQPCSGRCRQLRGMRHVGEAEQEGLAGAAGRAGTRWGAGGG